jgi:hypothetical protein
MTVFVNSVNSFFIAVDNYHGNFSLAITGTAMPRSSLLRARVPQYTWP